MPQGFGPVTLSGPPSGEPDAPGGAMALPGAPPGPAAPAMLMQEAIKARARVEVMSARKTLERALPILGSGTEEGEAIVKALTALKNVSLDVAPGLEESESAASQPDGAPQPITRGASSMSLPLPPVGAPPLPTLGGMGRGVAQFPG